MCFYFLKYLQPTHYFQKFTKNGKSVYPNPDYLPKEVVSLLQKDDGYDSSIAQNYDLSWQAVQKGYIGDDQTFSSFETLSLKDNYHFIRKYFHPAWVYYVLLIRLLSFKNPYREITSWYKTRMFKRGISYAKPIIYPKWSGFESLMIQQLPLVSVVIPTLNRYDYLKDVLKDFEQQDYKNFEVIVVDQSDDFDKEFYDQFNLSLQIIHQVEKALWLARNTAIRASKGSIIALSEDDVRIQKNWISMHLKCLDFFDAHVSAGVFYPQGESIPAHRSFFAIASQFATGNAMLRKTVFETVGLFDRQFEKQRMGDGEFGLRAYLKGLKSISNPYAACIDVKAGTGGLREMGSWDAFRPSNIFAPRPIPSVLYYYRKYFGNKAARRALLKTIPQSVMPYKFKKNNILTVIGVLLSFFLLPLIAVQVYRAWKLSDIKLKEGAKIEYL